MNSSSRNFASVPSGCGPSSIRIVCEEIFFDFKRPSRPSTILPISELATAKKVQEDVVPSVLPPANGRHSEHFYVAVGNGLFML
jgi:hypothetical protein